MTEKDRRMTDKNKTPNITLETASKTTHIEEKKKRRNKYILMEKERISK